MNYRINQKNGDKLSILGYGCMRFSRKGAAIDQEKTDAELLAAYEAGVNYFDTAYIYPGSEAALGKFIARHNCRTDINIATKLPQYLIKRSGDMERYFNEQLSRLQTDYIDYYLMHMLSDATTWERLDEFGVRRWLEEKRASGAIRNLGFSYHGDTANFKKLIDSYDWDFCQIQFNYLDEHTQAGIEGLNYAHEKGLPVIIMEPLRGGRLVNKLPQKVLAEFSAREPLRSPAAWALAWIWNHEQVNVVLSGMNDIAQIQDNCDAAANAVAGQLSRDDLEFIERIRDEIVSGTKVGCTGCNYCQPCPKGVSISNCFAFYNESFSDSYFNALKGYVMTTSVRKNKSNASLCVGCGCCEQHCPQGISIRKELKNVTRRFETPIYKIGVPIVNAVMKS